MNSEQAPIPTPLLQAPLQSLPCCRYPYHPSLAAGTPTIPPLLQVPLPSLPCCRYPYHPSLAAGTPAIPLITSQTSACAACLLCSWHHEWSSISARSLLFSHDLYIHMGELNGMLHECLSSHAVSILTLALVQLESMPVLLHVPRVLGCACSMHVVLAGSEKSASACC